MGETPQESRMPHAQCQVCGQQLVIRGDGGTEGVPVTTGAAYMPYARGWDRSGSPRSRRQRGPRAPTGGRGRDEKGGIARARFWNKVSGGRAGEPVRYHRPRGGTVVGSSKSIDHLLATAALARWYEYGQSAALQGEPLDPCPNRRASWGKKLHGSAVACLLSRVHQMGLHEG